MSYTNREIRQGIKLHFIETNKFVLNLFVVETYLHIGLTHYTWVN